VVIGGVIIDNEGAIKVEDEEDDEQLLKELQTDLQNFAN
jgi:hypothetical protein